MAGRYRPPPSPSIHLWDEPRRYRGIARAGRSIPAAVCDSGRRRTTPAGAGARCARHVGHWIRRPNSRKDQTKMRSIAQRHPTGRLPGHHLRRHRGHLRPPAPSLDRPRGHRPRAARRRPVHPPLHLCTRRRRVHHDGPGRGSRRRSRAAPPGLQLPGQPGLVCSRDRAPAGRGDRHSGRHRGHRPARGDRRDPATVIATIAVVALAFALVNCGRKRAGPASPSSGSSLGWARSAPAS